MTQTAFWKQPVAAPLAELATTDNRLVEPPGKGIARGTNAQPQCIEKIRNLT